ncbi:cysteine desulfurase family protein [Sporosarcina sp. G11-34]|uniref:cysteine desulfurase family protein n=1 Tax=Sporosarcina sp. G11-34 TaxID=2849605 RepID=UPI0022A9F372|nr:cysteine desulfurase family protein [Sporosarcina sp. G11-34]MCZ2257965.1 cysteine desulfurase [Sporosarcina sp. G11-34]
MIYLDNSATTAPDEEVLSSFMEVNRRYFANPASLHLPGKEAETLLERSREQILSILGAADGEVIFMSGGTEANNLAIVGLARALRSRGQHIITTPIEHPSVLRAINYLEKEGFEIDYLSVDKQGLVDPKELAGKIQENTILVSIMHVNNEIGTVQPIAKCAEIIKEKSRAVFHSDAVQSFGKLPISLSSDGPDVITISAHKINGLKGSGILAMKKGIKIEAVNFGGGQEKGLRSGTVSVPNAVAIAKAMRLSVSKNDNENYKLWRKRLVNFINEFNDVVVLAEEAGAPHILSIAFYKIKGEIAVNHFQENGIIVSTSSACSSKSGRAGHVIEAIRLPENYKHGVIRVSFGSNTEKQHIEQFEKAFTQFIDLLGRGKKYEVE